MAECSIEEVMTCPFVPSPLSKKLIPSVPPEVKMISSGLALKKEAVFKAVKSQVMDHWQAFAFEGGVDLDLGIADFLVDH